MLLDVMISVGQKEKVVVTLDLIKGGVSVLYIYYMIVQFLLASCMQKPSPTVDFTCNGLPYKKITFHTSSAQ